jgi:hypothetical protein
MNGHRVADGGPVVPVGLIPHLFGGAPIPGVRIGEDGAFGLIGLSNPRLLIDGPPSDRDVSRLRSPIFIKPPSNGGTL